MVLDPHLCDNFGVLLKFADDVFIKTVPTTVSLKFLRRRPLQSFNQLARLPFSAPAVTRHAVLTLKDLQPSEKLCQAHDCLHARQNDATARLSAIGTTGRHVILQVQVRLRVHLPYWNQ